MNPFFLPAFTSIKSDWDYFNFPRLFLKISFSLTQNKIPDFSLSLKNFFPDLWKPCWIASLESEHDPNSCEGSKTAADESLNSMRLLLFFSNSAIIVVLYLSSVSFALRNVQCTKYFSAKAEAILVGLVFPEIRVVCHFSLIVRIPTLSHAQWHKTLWWIRCHLCLCYGKGRCIIEKILQHFLRVFHKSVQAGWCWLTCRCLLGQLVQGFNWDTNLSSCVVNRCTSIH